MAASTSKLPRYPGRGDTLEPILHLRVSNAVAHFAQCLPFRIRCSSDLDAGLSWAKRDVALLQSEIAPDPPGWKTALRFDVDCPCDRQPHARSGYCPSAAMYWRDAALPQPSFIVVNPANGHAHYVYMLRGWIRVDGKDAQQLAAVRYYAAIERAYTRALHADPGYAGLVQHNPFSARYETLLGRDEPYSLEELGAHVTLPSLARRSATTIRTDGRNVETFDRLRTWAYVTIGEYRCGPRETWDAVVQARAIAIAADVRAGHPQTTHPYLDHEAAATAKSVASWVWSRYDGGNRTRVEAATAVHRENDRKAALAARRKRGSIAREYYLAEVQRRRSEAHRLRGLGVAIEDIARRLGAGVRSVHRWISEIRCVPSPSALSDFGRRLAPSPSQSTFSVTVDSVDSVPSLPCPNGQRPGEGFPSAQPMGGTGCLAHSAKPATDLPTLETEMPGELTGSEGPMAYIRRRIVEITRVGRPP